MTDVKTKHPGGRPTVYSEKLGSKICNLVLTSFRGLRWHCRQNKDLPNYKTIIRWLFKNKYPEFTDAYYRAKAEQSDMMADEMIDIAYKVEPTVNAVKKAQLQVDTLKWVSAKLKPKKYGDRILQEHTGSDGNAIKIENNKMDLSKLSDEELIVFRRLSEKITIEPTNNQS